MKYSPNHLVFICCSLLTDVAIAADLSFQGTTGVLNTPNAAIIDEGEFTYQFNNHIEDAQRSENTSFYNHVFAIGLSPYLEIGGRLTDYRPEGERYAASGFLRGKRDLSGNFKIKFPKITTWQPDIAFGINDFAGQAVNFRSQYLVVSDTLKKAHYSLGYAVGDHAAFNGAFANLNIDFNNDFSLLAEYDTNAFNLGVNYDLLSLTKLPLSIKASTPIDNPLNNDVTMGISFTLPFDGKRQSKKHHSQANNLTDVIARLTGGSESDRINDLMNKLADYGLEHLKAGRDASGKYIIAAENRVYNHSHMDALALMLGVSHEFLADKELLQIILVEQDTAIFTIETTIQPYAQYIADGKASSQQTFKQQLKVGFPEPHILSSSTIQWFEGVNKGSSPRFDVKLQPAFSTAIGHEWGVFDYSLALQTDVSLSLWKGGSLLVSGDVALDASKNYEEGKAFADSHHESGLKQVLAQQYYKPHKNVSTLSSMGKVTVNKNRYNTLQSEARWVANTGIHQLSSKFAYFKPDDVLQDNHQLAIASYGYFMPERDLSFEVSYGEFFEGDVGVRYQLKKQFGDTELGGFLKYVDTNDIVGGLSITLPLTPRRDYKNKAAIIRGTQALNYNFATTIEHPTRPSSNGVRPNMMLEPKLANRLSRDHLDSNRLTEQYFKTHLNRLREAYFMLR